MNKNREPAFPTKASHIGLSKLEFAAIEITKAICGRPTNQWPPQDIAKHSVAIAVEIFKATDKE